jgi:hypothetical protein
MMPRLNALRVNAGLPEVSDPIAHMHRPDRLLALTGAPLEYARVDTPEHVRFVGAQLWVIVTLADAHGVGELPAADNVRIERFVPQFGRDQPEVGRRIAESGAGVLVKKKDLSASRIRSAVRLALTMRPVAVSPGGPAVFAGAVEELLPVGLELKAHDRSLIK